MTPTKPEAQDRPDLSRFQRVGDCFRTLFSRWRLPLPLRMNRSAFLRLLGIALLGAAFVGCGGGIGYTGGGIPPGRSAITGVVVDATDPTKPVPNAMVTIAIGTVGYDDGFYREYSDSKGAFNFQNVPTGVTTSNISFKVVPPDATRQQQAINFLLTNGRATDVVAALPPATVDLSKAKSVALQPQTPQNGATSGNSSVVTFKPVVLDADGKPLGIVPSLILDGSTVTINTDGTFVATGVVSGTVSADIDTGTGKEIPSPAVAVAAPDHQQLGNNTKAGK